MRKRARILDEYTDVDGAVCEDCGFELVAPPLYLVEVWESAGRRVAYMLCGSCATAVGADADEWVMEHHPDDYRWDD